MGRLYGTQHLSKYADELITLSGRWKERRVMCVSSVWRVLHVLFSSLHRILGMRGGGFINKRLCV